MSNQHNQRHETQQNSPRQTGTTRRTLLAGVGTAVLGTTVGGFGSATALSATRTEETQRETKPVDNSDVEWSFETEQDFVESSPTVRDGVVYFGDGEFGTDNGTIHAVDIETQELLWSESVPAQIRYAPHVVFGAVYTGGTNGVAYAHDAEDGEELWQFPTDEPIAASPTRFEELVYLSSEDGFLYAVAAETGEEEWTYDIGYPVSTAPTVVDGVVYVGDNPRETDIEGWVHAVDAETGTVEWTFEDADLWINSSPTVANGTVYVGCDDTTLYALDADDGGVEWEFTDPDEQVISSTTYHDGVVYVGTDQDGPATTGIPAVLYAVDAATGDKIWEFSVGPDEDNWRFHSSPTVAGDTVFIGSHNGTVYGVDVETGDEVWSFETGAAVWSSPTVVDGTLYVGSDDGNLYALSVPERGSSECSRVNLGTLGHHHVWTGLRGPEPNPGTVFGTVTDDAQESVEGATVSLLDNGTELTSTETDASGEYALSATPGTYELVVEAFGFRQFSDMVLVEEDGELERDIVLTPLEPGQMAGTVTDPDGTERAGVEVKLFFDGERLHTVTTDGSGEYMTGDVVPATYRVVVVIDEGDRYLTANEPVTIEEDELKTKDIAVSEGPPPLPGREKPPTQAPGLPEDGLFEDVTGDGQLDIVDVQAFFIHFDSDELQQYAQFYNFSGLDDSVVSIFDVQALFNRLSAGE